MVKVTWTDRALGQIERAILYIKDERGISYATIVLVRVIKLTSLLTEHPRLGQEEPRATAKT